jgi:hypothetical protein
VGLEREAAVSDDLRQSWQVRLGIMGDRWTDTASDGYRASGLDLMGTASGMYHFDWKWAGIGLGGMVGVGSMRSPNPLFIPLGTSGFVMPGLYLRLGPYPFGFELGTGARDQFVPGAFFGWRGIIRRQEFRLGLETTESRRPFIIGMVYGDVRLRLTDGLALRLRLDVPLTGKTLEGTLAWAVSF